jgi:AraC family transcriptional regulator
MLTDSLPTHAASSASCGCGAPPFLPTTWPPSQDRRFGAGGRPVRWQVPSTRRLYDRRATESVDAAVQISPPDRVKRHAVAWDGMAAEIVQSASHDRIECRFRAPTYLLVVYEQGTRRDGETFVQGLPRSTLRDFARKLTFVPAGHDYREWQLPRAFTRLMYVYVDPAVLQVHSELDVADVSFASRLFFEDATLWDTALKLMRSVESPTSEDHLYREALGVVLVHELVRLNRGAPRIEPQVRGGLAAWQQRIVTAYIEDHLAESIPLATFAQLVRLSPHYFCRAFKQSFGIPPHRYHTTRRIERAKVLLAKRAISVTDIGLRVGFSETSSFTTAFRKATGLTPSGYHRSIG